MSGVTKELEWAENAPVQFEARGDRFFYLVNEVEGHFDAVAISHSGTIDVEVAYAVEPTLDDAKRAAQLWESDGPVPSTRTGRDRVYFRGYVEYNVHDALKLMDATGNEWAPGTPGDKAAGSLIDHTTQRFGLKDLFAVDGAKAESMRVSTSLDPSVEGPEPL